MPVNMIASRTQTEQRGLPVLAGPWRVDPARSHTSFAARVAGHCVRGRLPMTGSVLISEPVGQSTARLAARTGAISTGSPALDRVLAGPGFLDARNFPEISFLAELVIRVPSGWRAVGRLRVRDAEHELACQLGTQDAERAPTNTDCVIIGCTWVLDAQWVTSHRIPALSRRVVMTSSLYLEPGT
jgi:polyisoprenoid-binding protein YceI